MAVTDTLEDVRPRHRPRNSLVAAAQRLVRKVLKRKGNSGKTEEWQEDAWDMYDLVGEQRFLANTLANRLAQARFFVGRLPQDTTESIEVVDSGPAYDVFQSMVGRGEHFKQMIQRLGVNLFQAGDGYLLGVPAGLAEAEVQPNLRDGITPIGVDDDPLAGIDIATLEWTMHSTTEIKIDASTGDITVMGEGDREKNTFNADAVILIRVWRPHPRRWWQADSPTRSSLPVLRELVGLTMKIAANIDSRLAGAGVFLVPSEADAALRAASGATGEEDLSPFAEAVMDAMITPISDRSSASSVVPVMPVVPGATIEQFKWIKNPNSEQDPEDRANRTEAIRRIALGQDCPPELLLGVAGMNHWGAWLVREDVVTTHLEPPLALICDAITQEFLWLVLEQQGVADFHDYVIWYDVEHMIQRPNRAQDAKDAHSAGVINDETYRDALGFDEADAPVVEPTDPVVQLVLDMVRKAPALASNPGLSVLAEQVRAMLAGQVIPVNAPADAAPPEAPAEEEPPAEEGGPPATQDAPAEEPAE